MESGSLLDVRERFVVHSRAFPQEAKGTGPFSLQTVYCSTSSRPQNQFPTTTQPTSHKPHSSQETDTLMPGTPIPSGALPCQLAPCSSPRARALRHTEPNTRCQFAEGCPGIVEAATLQQSGQAPLASPSPTGTTCSSLLIR